MSQFIHYFQLHFLSLSLTFSFLFFFFNDTAPTEIYTLSLHDALPISNAPTSRDSRRSVSGLSERIRIPWGFWWATTPSSRVSRSEEHTSELQSRFDLVCRLLLEKKKIKNNSKSQINHIDNVNASCCK